MTKFTVDFPVIAWGSTEVEFDGTAEELEDAILNDEFDVNLDASCIQNWRPLMNTNDIDFGSVEAPDYLEVSE